MTPQLFSRVQGQIAELLKEIESSYHGPTINIAVTERNWILLNEKFSTIHSASGKLKALTQSLIGDPTYGQKTTDRPKDSI